MKKSLFIILWATLAVACGHSGDSDDYTLLMSMQKKQEIAHLEKDAALLTDMLADPFINIDSGKIDTVSRRSATIRFQSYFDQVEFVKWENIRQPAITISDDGTMATILVQKFVHLKLPGSGDTTESKTTFTWLETWRKIDGVWKMTMIASTERDGGPDI